MKMTLPTAGRNPNLPPIYHRPNAQTKLITVLINLTPRINSALFELPETCTIWSVEPHKSPDVTLPGLHIWVDRADLALTEPRIFLGTGDRAGEAVDVTAAVGPRLGKNIWRSLGDVR